MVLPQHPEAAHPAPTHTLGVSATARPWPQQGIITAPGRITRSQASSGSPRIGSMAALAGHYSGLPGVRVMRPAALLHDGRCPPNHC